MHLYRERLWPAPWLFISTALVIPASLLVFLPISTLAGVLVAVVLYAGCAIALLASAPLIEVTAEHLVAGRARVPLAVIGEATPYSGADATAQRGPELDARAWLVIRGWVSPVVKVVLHDEHDPVPYWLLSTRKPDALVAAIESARAVRS